MMKQMCKQGERIELLKLPNRGDSALQIIQNPEHFCFGTDAVLLAAFADIKPHSVVMDLCTGTGIVPLLLSGNPNAVSIDGLELQAEMAEMASRSVRLNGLEHRITIQQGDVVHYSTEKRYDAVTCNPPYKKANSGKVNVSDAQAVARHEIYCCLEDVVHRASVLLKPLGRFSMVHRPERLCDILSCMRAERLEPKRIRLVYPKENKPPVLVLVEGRKDTKPYLSVEAPLIVYGQDGSYTPEMQRIYGRATWAD